MRIAYMLTLLGIGGAEKQVIAIGELMASRGHEVVLVVLRSAQEHECPTKLHVHHLGIKKSFPGVMRGMVRARQLLRSFKPDLLHSHTFPANMMARMLRAGGAAPAVLSTIHNVFEGSWHRTLAYRITDPLSIHTSGVSQAVADRYLQLKAVPRSKLSVITNGIDTEVFAPSSLSAIAPSQQSGFIWLAAGRDVPAKDFDNLIVAFQKIREEVPDTQLWIAGKPASHRIPPMDANAIGLRWLGLSHNMPGTLASCDAFVLSSAWEGMPLVVGEAMAMEKPVVATDVGGVRELVGDTGIIVPSRSPQALAEAMLRVMRLKQSERRAMGKAARARIVQSFDIKAKADEWEFIYTRMLRDRS